MIKERIVILLIALYTFSNISCQQNNFRLYYSSDGDFSFSALEDVDVKKIQQTADNKFYLLYSYSFEKDGLVFNAAYYPIVWDLLGIENEENILLDNMVQGAADNSEGRVETRSRITFKNSPGREFTIVYTDGGIIKGRIYIIDRKVYMVQVSSDKRNEISNHEVDSFLKSFVKGKIQETQPTNPSINSSELSLIDLESYLLSSKNTIDFDLKQRGWKYVGTHNLENYSTGYQYVFQKEKVFSQIICYIDNKMLLYIPSIELVTTIEKAIRAKYPFSKSQQTLGTKQDVFLKDKISIFITYGEKKMITLVWNVKE